MRQSEGITLAALEAEYARAALPATEGFETRLIAPPSFEAFLGSVEIVDPADGLVVPVRRPFVLTLAQVMVDALVSTMWDAAGRAPVMLRSRRSGTSTLRAAWEPARPGITVESVRAYYEREAAAAREWEQVGARYLASRHSFGAVDPNAPSSFVADDDVVATLMEFARAGERGLFDELATMRGVAPAALEELWSGTCARLGIREPTDG